MASGDIIWPPATGSSWRIGGREYLLASIRSGTEEAMMTPAVAEGRTSAGFAVLKEEWEDFMTRATQVNA